MIDVHQNTTLSESFEGDRSHLIGNRCKDALIGLLVILLSYDLDQACSVVGVAWC